MIQIWATPRGPVFHESFRGEIYGHKELIKAVHGRWNPKSKQWSVTWEQAEQLILDYPNAFQLAVPCKVDCNCVNHFQWDKYVSLEDAVVGTFVQDSCAHCDSGRWNNVVVVEVYNVE